MNSAALPEQLVESELFGHERGAFTGADRLRRGAFENAGSGTLFLDEVGELPLPAQAKLLRVLEDRKVTRVGGDRAIQVTARVVAATNRDLEREVEAGRFRQDLYYRLNVHTLRVPPLRERLSDVPALVDHLLRSIASHLGVRPKTIAPDAVALLAAYDWRKNNVRELRNCLERMMIASDAAVIGAADVPPEIRGEERDEAADATRPARDAQGAEGAGRTADRARRAREARLARHADGRGARPCGSFQPVEDHAPPRIEQGHAPGRVDRLRDSACARRTPAAPDAVSARTRSRHGHPRSRRNPTTRSVRSQLAHLSLSLHGGRLLALKASETLDRMQAVGQPRERTDETHTTRHGGAAPGGVRGRRLFEDDEATQAKSGAGSVRGTPKPSRRSSRP